MEIPKKFKISKVPQISLGNHLTSSYFEKTSLFMLLFCVYSNDDGPGKNVIINYQDLPSGQSISQSAKNSTEQAITAVEGTTLSTLSLSPWPMGKYCMFKLHNNQCPSGLAKGEDNFTTFKQNSFFSKIYICFVHVLHAFQELSVCLLLSIIPRNCWILML